MKYFCPLSIYWKGLWKFQHIPVAKFSTHFSHNCQTMVSMAHVCTCVQRYVFSHKWCQDRKGGGKVFMVCGCTGNQRSKMSKVTRWFILGQGRGVTVIHTQCWACWWLGKMCKVLPVCFETFSEYIPSCSREKKRTGPPTCCTWNNGKLVQLDASEYIRPCCLGNNGGYKGQAGSGSGLFSETVFGRLLSRVRYLPQTS